MVDDILSFIGFWVFDDLDGMIEEDFEEVIFEVIMLLVDEV